MMSRSLVLALLTFAAFAGCLGSEDPKDATPSWDEQETLRLAAIQERLDADRLGLPCAPAYTAHATSPMFSNVSEYIWPEEGGHGEMEVLDGTNLVFVSRYGGGGFEVMDVTDPYAPVHAVSFQLNESFSLDIKISTDGKTLLSGGFGAISIVDISDPYNPVYEKTVAYPQEAAMTLAQSHMLAVANISGTDYVFAASQIAHGVLIFRMTGEPGARDLEFLTYFAPVIGGPLAAHDMFVMDDPVEGKPLLWVANGFGGFIVADVSDPALPIVVANGPQYDPYQGYTHTVSVTFVGDRRIAATMAEIGNMALKIYDVTILQAPVLLGTWHVNEMPDSTQHNTQILGDWLFLSHYGEGFFMFNLTRFVEDVGPLPAYNIGPLAEAAGGAVLVPDGQWKPEAGSVWETIVVNGVNYATAGTFATVLNGCLDAGNPDLDAYL